MRSPNIGSVPRIVPLESTRTVVCAVAKRGVTVRFMRTIRKLSSSVSTVSDLLTVVAATAALLAWIAPTRPAARADASAYTFITGSGASPAVWDCREPITVRFNTKELLSSDRDPVMRDFEDAIADVNAHSAFTLVSDGATDIIPTDASIRTLDHRSGSPDVVVYFGPGANTDLSDPSAAATGGIISSPWKPGLNRTHAGYVFVDVASLGDYRPGGGYMSRRALFTHELLHVIGLGHTRRPDSVMTPRVGESFGEIGPGDVAGLAILARLADCSS